MKRLNNPKVSRGKEQRRDERTQRGIMKWKITRNKEALRHTEQDKRQKVAQERQKGRLRKRKPRREARNRG